MMRILPKNSAIEIKVFILSSSVAVHKYTPDSFFEKFSTLSILFSILKLSNDMSRSFNDHLIV